MSRVVHVDQSTRKLQNMETAYFFKTLCWPFVSTLKTVYSMPWTLKPWNLSAHNKFQVFHHSSLFQWENHMYSTVCDKIKQLTLEGWFRLSDLHDDHKSPQLCLSYRKDKIIHNYTKKYMYVFPSNILVQYLTILLG